MVAETEIVDKHIQDLNSGNFRADNPFFFHPDYKLEFTNLRFKRDAASQPIVDTVFNVKPKDQAVWDTAEVLSFISRIVYYLKSFVQCSRVCVNYDTATGGLSQRRYATINVVYLIDKKMQEYAREQYQKGEIMALQSPKLI